MNKIELICASSLPQKANYHMKLSMGLKNACWVSMHEVVVRMLLGKRVPLGCLHEILRPRSMVILV
jgi:hypothetical protein